LPRDTYAGNKGDGQYAKCFHTIILAT
jgi:hypothetical protein